MAFGLHARRTTVGALGLFALVLYTASVLKDFGVLDISGQINGLVGLLGSLVVFTEVGMKGKLRGLELGALIVAGLVALAGLGELVGVQFGVLSFAMGTLKAVVAVTALAMIFTKQSGE